jgi:hypothetical protein
MYMRTWKCLRLYYVVKNKLLNLNLSMLDYIIEFFCMIGFVFDTSSYGVDFVIMNNAI